jgi:hypothetical protein
LQPMMSNSSPKAGREWHSTRTVEREWKPSDF